MTSSSTTTTRRSSSCGQDIDEILATSTKIDHNTDTGGGASVFSKAFIAEEGAQGSTWTTPSSGRRHAQAAQGEEIPDEFLSRKRKSEAPGWPRRATRASTSSKRREEGRKYRDGEKDAALRRHLRDLVEDRADELRAPLLSFGRAARRVSGAGGGRHAAARGGGVARFGVAFVCLCCGVPVGAVGANIAAGAPTCRSAPQGARPRRQLGLAPPSLTPQQAAELAPYVTEGGDEHARRVHKLGEQFLRRLSSSSGYRRRRGARRAAHPFARPSSAATSAATRRCRGRAPTTDAAPRRVQARPQGV